MNEPTQISNTFRLSNICTSIRHVYNNYHLNMLKKKIYFLALLTRNIKKNPHDDILLCTELYTHT